MRRMIGTMALACMVATSASAAGRAAAAEALVATMVRGQVEQAGHAVRVLDELAPGTELRLGERAVAIVWWRQDGRRIALAGPGRFRLEARGATPLSAGASTVVMPAPDRAQAGGRPDEAMAGAVLRAPPGAQAADTVLALSHPWLAWPRRAHVGNWTVRLRDEGGALLHQAEVADNRYAVPAAAGLEPGRAYLFELGWTTSRQGEQLESRRIVTLARADDAAIAAWRAPQDAPLAQRVAYADILARHGLHALASLVCPECADTPR